MLTRGPASEDHDGDRPRAGRGRRGAGAGQRAGRFGGAVWWFRPALVAVMAFLLVAPSSRNACGPGPDAVLEEPADLARATGPGAGRSSSLCRCRPGWHAALARGARGLSRRGRGPRLVQADDPEAVLPIRPPVRSPATLDRAATLRWLVGAAACLGIFWAVSHFADRLGRLYLVWGCVVAAFVLNAALGLVQIGGQAEGLYGFYLPGSGPAWAPSLDDLLESPAPAALRRLERLRPGSTSRRIETSRPRSLIARSCSER